MAKNDETYNPYMIMESVLTIMGSDPFYEWGEDGELFKSPLLKGVVKKVVLLPSYTEIEDEGIEDLRLARAIVLYLMNEERKGNGELLLAVYLTCKNIYTRVKEKHDVDLNIKSPTWYYKELKTISEQINS